MTERRETDPQPEKPKNVAPDAVKDPNAKTEGKPGLGTPSGGTQNDETDPGGS
ncbi:hypothetical protein PQI07_15350 [Methylobacterium sp. 092160098-2]|uniref:hypothetical protein n=1 Tax=Methylobacterium sp. 092160098-2 TaxID=3025129 RepID=UPI0023819756|nr:hypothetical protein [Methylobacterium sp. 092160098-2]MDE4912064.1 hypothetical protein [Methylobacterium sp. 092160098-2]